MMKKNNFIDSVNILGGKVTFDVNLDENTPLEVQSDWFGEDIMQIEYGERFILDVGWRTNFAPGTSDDRSGRFIVTSIQDNDWQHPLFRDMCSSFAELRTAIERAATVIVSMQKIKNLPYRDVE